MVDQEEAGLGYYTSWNIIREIKFLLTLLRRKKSVDVLSGS